MYEEKMSTVAIKQPLISVIIPAYNHERFIGAAVDSVLQQTLSDLELIVVDDGSTDRTGDIVKAYDDPRISYFHQENQDAYNTLNRGLLLAKGQYIAILNSDDVYVLNRLERLLEFSREKGAECVISDVIPISDEDLEFSDPQFLWNTWHLKNRSWYFNCRDIYTAFLKGNFMVTTSNLFMTAKAMRAVGSFCSLRYLHDYDYIFRMMLAFPDGVHYLDNEKLLYYRIHPGNTLSEAAISGRLQDQALISKYMMARIPEIHRKDIAIGAERLIELGNELHDVKKTLEPQQPRGVRPALRELLTSLASWIAWKFR
jgi:glycosyltransferase involved in cell wall biosynthesis